MRAAAILGPGKVAKYLAQFQNAAKVEWTSDLSPGIEAAVVFGGDGTIHRHLTSLSDLKVPTLIVPCGSGNDFARALNLKSVSDSLAAWRKFVGGNNNVHQVDLGVIRTQACEHLLSAAEAAPAKEAEIGRAHV